MGFAPDPTETLARARSEVVDAPAAKSLSSIATVAGLREGTLQITLAEPDPLLIHALADTVALLLQVRRDCEALLAA